MRIARRTLHEIGADDKCKSKVLDELIIHSRPDDLVDATTCAPVHHSILDLNYGLDVVKKANLFPGIVPEATAQNAELTNFFISPHALC